MSHKTSIAWENSILYKNNEKAQNDLTTEPNEAWAKWQTLCKPHFQMHFLD